MKTENDSRILSNCTRYNDCNELVRQYQGLIISAVHKALTRRAVPYSADDVNELVNETWCSLFDDGKKKLKQHDAGKGSSLSTWIWMIASQTVIAHYRSKNVKPDSEFVPEDLENLLADEDHFKLVERKDSLAFVKQSLEKLSPQERLVLKMILFHDMKPAEVAEMTGIARNNVDQLKLRGMRKLKKILTQHQINL